MSLPSLPSQGEDPWFEKRNAWDKAVDQRLRYTIIATGRPDIAATTPYSSAQLNAMPSGTVYRSTNGPQGAWEWMKRGTAWVVTQGDTTSRDISSSLQAAWTGRVDIVRVGRAVDVFLYDLTAGAGAEDDFLTVPPGYRPLYRINPYNSWLVSNRNVGSSAPTIGRIGAYGGLLRVYGSGVSGMVGHLTYFTDDPWPTSLPGNPA